jgi:hypothetical protein
MIMGAARPSETSVHFYQTTWDHIPSQEIFIVVAVGTTNLAQLINIDRH